jgi:hypothetical protein
MQNLFKITALIFFILLLASCGNSGTKTSTDNTTQSATENAAAPADVPAIKKYGIKSGIVTFESSGMGITRKIVLYFDDFGAKEAEESYDENNNIEKTSLCDGKSRYTLVYKDKAAYKDGDCFRGVAYKFDWNEASRGGEEYKPTKLSNVTIAGKDCESFSLLTSGHTTVYAGWNNICLLIDQDSQYGKITYKATSFEENASIPSDKLNVPGDFKMN